MTCHQATNKLPPAPACPVILSTFINDLTIGWQNLNPLSHPNATLAPQARQARASGENLIYMTCDTSATSKAKW